MKAALAFFYPRMSKGALLIMHDYQSGTWPGATRAIDEFCAEAGQTLILLPDKSGTAVCRKSA
jgi:O-methyltransferase